MSVEILGRRVTLPVEVRDATHGSAMFLVPADGVNALLPGDAFEAIDMGGGMTQLILGLIDYRDNDLGDYNEIAVIFFVKPREADATAAGTFIYTLPVNQEFTCEAGRRIWGFPKTIEDCDFTYTDDALTGTLRMDGKHVFTLTVPRLAPLDPDDTSMQPSVTYTYIAGVPHRTHLEQGGPTGMSGGGPEVSLELGDHPLADELRSLGLPMDAIGSVWIAHMRGTFGPAQPL